MNSNTAKLEQNFKKPVMMDLGNEKKLSIGVKRGQ